MSKGPTKGPWTVADGTTSGKVVLALEEPKVRRNVAACGGPNRSGNATLIAAAPDMVQQLTSAAMAMDEAANVLEATYRGMAVILRTHAIEARAAIAKATGAGA